MILCHLIFLSAFFTIKRQDWPPCPFYRAIIIFFMPISVFFYANFGVLKRLHRNEARSSLSGKINEAYLSYYQRSPQLESPSLSRSFVLKSSSVPIPGVNSPWDVCTCIRLSSMQSSKCISGWIYFFFMFIAIFFC